jgi:hypothetical protein
MIPKDIQKYCDQHNIQIIRLSSGAVRYLGHRVDITLSQETPIKLADLKPYEPTKGRNLNNI